MLQAWAGLSTIKYRKSCMLEACMHSWLAIASSPFFSVLASYKCGKFWPLFRPPWDSSVWRSMTWIHAAIDSSKETTGQVMSCRLIRSA